MATAGSRSRPPCAAARSSASISRRRCSSCAANGRSAPGVSDRLTLLQADFRTFALAQPAGLIALPYHSLGHLTSVDEKRDALRHIHGQLRPGGRFVFDDFFMTPARLERMRQVQLRAEYRRRTATTRCCGSPRS